ncbi:hypothetical protein [uncultured Kordia sp.]|uniref:hypothetical protein n=1 Tax=uncultured Kordia sp. TaxID=507699 RepID=UPI00262623B2|nr:hypothetical protein [uncultured Kordia sp.]
MIKNILNLLVVLLCLQTINAQNDTEIVEKFLKSIANQDTASLSQYLHEDVLVVEEDSVAFNTREKFLKRLESFKTWNTQISDIEVSEFEGNIEFYFTSTNEYYSLLGIAPFNVSGMCFLSDGKIKKIQGEEWYYVYDSVFFQTYEQIEFAKWLAKANLSISDFPKTKSGYKLLLNLAKRYKNAKLSKEEEQEIATFINGNIVHKRREFISNDSEGIKTFVYNLIMAFKAKKYKEIQEMYITEQEFVELWQHYGGSPAKGIHEFKENVKPLTKDRFDDISGIDFYTTVASYKMVSDEDLDKVPFSKILRKKALQGKEEYYFSEDEFRIEYIYDGLLTSVKRLKLGEIIYIPNKGWRLTNLN